MTGIFVIIGYAIILVDINATIRGSFVLGLFIISYAIMLVGINDNSASFALTGIFVIIGYAIILVGIIDNSVSSF